MGEWNSARRSGSVQMLGIYTNRGWNIGYGSKDQIGAATLRQNQSS